MATIEVSTWDELTAAVTSGYEDTSEATIININADIDMVDNILSPSTSFVSTYNTKTITINGNDHTINGLTIYGTGSQLSMFVCYQYPIIVNDLKLTNLQLNNYSFLSVTSYGSNKTPDLLQINNCQINGDMNGYFCSSAYTQYVIHTASYVHFYECSINISSINFFRSCFLEKCWVHIEPYQESQSISIGVSGQTFATAYGQSNYCGIPGANNTYIEGNIGSWVIQSGSTTTSYARNLFIPQNNTAASTYQYKCYNNVINLEMAIDIGSLSTGWGGCSGAGADTDTTTSLINGDRITVTTTSTDVEDPTAFNTITESTGVVLTDSQIKDASYINSNTGFPISV